MRIIYLLCISLILSACATAYQREGATGGYTETQLDTNVFQVTFRGNGYTARQRAADFALLRSAEITLENGYNYFVIIDASQYSKQSSYTTPTTTYGSATAYGNTAYGTAITYGGQTYHISKPRATNTIICFKEKPEGFAYNATFIEKSMKDKYQLNKPNKAN
jgi:hypothetical protein